MSTATKSSHKTTAPTAEKDSANGKNGVRRTASATQGHQNGMLYAAPPMVGLSQPIQAKLTVGQPNDTYESEADSVAEEVVTGQPGTEISRLPATPQRQPVEEDEETLQAQFLQRQEDTEEESLQTLQRQPGEGEEETVQTLQRQPLEEGEEESIQAQLLQRQEVTEEESLQTLQRQPAEEEEAVQTTFLQRQSESKEEEAVQRKTAVDEETIQGHQSGVPRVSASTEATIRNPGMGSSIPAPVRQPIEQRVGADLSGVQVHTDTRAQNAAASVQARAFTHTNHIFLAPRESSSNIRLMAHEATHVVQQGAAPTIQRKPLSRATPQVQRLPGFITDRLASYARYIPGYTLFTVIIGFNPLTASRVERTAVNLLDGLMGLVPSGAAIFDKLSELGIIQDAFTWVEGQLATLDLSLSRIERLVEEAWDEMDFIRLDPFDYNLGVITRKFESLLDDVTTFATNLVSIIIQLIKDAAIGVAEGLLADNAAWALIKKVIHYDPLRDEPVEATTEEILADFLMLIGKEQELAQMRERGTLAETAVWLDTQIGTFLALLGQFRNLISAAWDAIQPENLPNLMTNLQTMAGQVVDLLQGVWDFATTVAVKVLELIKNALLGWLKSFATDIPGYHLLTVILGKDIFTQEEVPRTPINLIRGFMSLIPGGERQFQQMQETGVIPQAAQRIEALLTQLGISWAFVQELFLGIWNALTIEDLLSPLETFARITAQFGEPISRLFTFVVKVVKIVLELVLQMMNFPLDIIQRIISNAMQAFEDIKRDPIGFLKNMLEAVKLGFSNFFENILQHLLSGVTDWLFGQLSEAGISPPADFSLSSILDFVLQVLGISMDRIWEKLAERIGQENVERIRGAIDRLVGIWNFIRDVQERGVAAIWEYIESQISNLWDMVLEQARNWIVTRIIEQVTVKLLSLLDPTGIMAVVNSFIAFFKAIQSAIEYLRAMLLIVDDYVSTIAAVARGEIQPGAAKMEQGLANSIPVAIGFLANQVGLGRLADKIAEIIGSIREVVDRALDWLIDRAVTMGQALLRTLGLGGESGSDEAADTEVGTEEDMDPTDHTAFAQHAATLLKEAPLTTGDSVRDAAESFAAQQEPILSARLEDGIGLRYVFSGQPDDEADGTIDFSVVIAPNDTTYEDEISVPEDAYFTPRASAPGIGNIARHGQQVSSLRNEDRLWWLESEHILPFATGRSLWQALGLYLPERGWREDTQQTTIMIYERAARIKTPEDNVVSRQFTNALENLNIAGMFQNERSRYAAGDENALASSRDILERVLRSLNQARADAVSRTNESIAQENQQTEEGCTEINGQRRAAPPNTESLLPTPANVETASHRQYDDILRLVTEELLSVEERRRRIDRMLGNE